MTVSTTPIIKSKIKQIKNINIKEINHIKREKILKNLDKDLSSGTYELLKKKLPYFYTISLQKFPTKNKLIQVKKDLSKISGISKVETFSKDHDHIYSLLLLLKTIVSVLFFLISIFTFLILLNNVKIWFFEHQERLSIIKLHGGSIYYGARPIIYTAILSSIFSSLLVVYSVYFITKNLGLVLGHEVIEIIKSNIPTFTIVEVSFVFILSIILSLITVFGILVKHRLK